MKEFKVKTTDKNGNDVLLDVLATYHDEDTKKDYVIFTNNSFNEKSELNISYSLYETVNGKMQFIEITSEEDKAIALEIIDELTKKEDSSIIS